MAHPPEPSPALFECQLHTRVRVSFVLLSLTVWGLVGLFLHAHQESGAGLLLLPVAAATTILALDVYFRRIRAGSDWISGRTLTGWHLIPAKSIESLQSASSPFIGGDWVFFRGGGHTVSLSSSYEDAIEVLELLAPHFDDIRMDARTRERLS